MTDFSLKAARIQFAALLAVLAVALVVAAGITTGAFVLSFSVLRDLARQGLLHEDLAWIFPAMIDGAIFLSTVAVVVLGKLDIAARDKRFYVALAVVVICISVYGNAYHAYHAASAAQRDIAAGMDIGFVPLSPTGAALIAVIPPFLVLALTHGVGILIKAIGAAHAQYQTAVRRNVDEQQQSNDPPRSTHLGAEQIDLDAAGTFSGAQYVAPRLQQDPPQLPLHIHAATDPAVSTADTPTPVAEESSPILDDVAPAQSSVAERGREASNRDSQASNGAGALTTVLRFVEQSDQFDDDPGVRATARLRLTEPDLTWAEIASRTDVRAASTALRRWGRAKDAIAGAGFILDDNRLPMQEQLPVRELVAP